MHDVVIIGGGPAGSTLAGLLAKAGRRALVVEREPFPRFHIGESLLPMSMEVLDQLSLRPRLDDRFLRKYGANFVDSKTGRQNTYLFREAFDKRFAYAYEVERAEFDELLLNRARELGADVLQPCRVRDVLFHGDRAHGVRVIDDTGEREIPARVVVDASGRGSMLASRNGAKGRIAGLDTASVFAHYRGVAREQGEAEGNITIVVIEGGWLWFIPFRGDITSVGAVVSVDYMRQRGKGESLAAFLDRTLARAPQAEQLLANAERVSEPRTAADFSYSVSDFAGDHWLCVGDATGFIDPLFSSGVHLAFKSAEMAAEAIDGALDTPEINGDAFSDYAESMRNASGMFLGAVQAFYEGSLRDMLFEQDQRPTLRQLVASMLAGDVVHNGKVPQWVSFVRRHFPPRFAD